MICVGVICVGVSGVLLMCVLICVFVNCAVVSGDGPTLPPTPFPANTGMVCVCSGVSVLYCVAVGPVIMLPVSDCGVAVCAGGIAGYPIPPTLLGGVGRSGPCFGSGLRSTLPPVAWLSGSFVSAGLGEYDEGSVVAKVCGDAVCDAVLLSCSGAISVVGCSTGAVLNGAVLLPLTGIIPVSLNRVLLSNWLCL